MDKVEKAIEVMKETIKLNKTIIAVDNQSEFDELVREVDEANRVALEALEEKLERNKRGV